MEKNHDTVLPDEKSTSQKNTDVGFQLLYVWISICSENEYNDIHLSVHSGYFIVIGFEGVKFLLFISIITIHSQNYFWNQGDRPDKIQSWNTRLDHAWRGAGAIILERDYDISYQLVLVSCSMWSDKKYDSSFQP